MDLLNKSSLGDACWYVFKINEKIQQKNKWEFESANASYQKHGKGDSISQNKGHRKYSLNKVIASSTHRCW